jgi:hypothetical protein
MSDAGVHRYGTFKPSQGIPLEALERNLGVTEQQKESAISTLSF